jgi:prepilin-type N-terminal cleavage/methylation domain-containing protein
MQDLTAHFFSAPVVGRFGSKRHLICAAGLHVDCGGLPSPRKAQASLLGPKRGQAAAPYVIDIFRIPGLTSLTMSDGCENSFSARRNAKRAARKAGFTLIELLIVVAIIAILAAIAVPNFLEAQARSKVSRAKADLRSLATALESYYVDENAYPLWYFTATYPSQAKASSQYPFLGYTPSGLTTPIAYMTALPKEPFEPSQRQIAERQPNPLRLFYYDSQTNWDFYYNAPGFWQYWAGDRFKWVLASIGPDNYSGITNAYGPTNNIVEVFQSLIGGSFPAGTTTTIPPTGRSVPATSS